MDIEKKIIKVILSIIAVILFCVVIYYKLIHCCEAAYIQNR